MQQAVDEAVLERAPRRLDDVRAHSDRGPVAFAVGRRQQHTGGRTGGTRSVEDAHLVVGEVDVGELRQHRADGSAQRGVDRVDRAVALGNPDASLGVVALADPDLHGRLGREVAARQFVGDHPHRLDPEELRHLADRSAHQQLERGIGGLEVVALVLETLQFVDDLVDLCTVELEADFVGLHLDRRPTGHLRHDESRPVADQFGVDVFVGVLRPDDGRHVQAGLVSERRRADIRSLGVDRTVERLGNVVTHGGQPFDATVGQAGVAELELQVRDHRGEVGVAGALTETVERALHVPGAGLDRGHRVGDRAAGVVVAVDADDGVVTDVRLDVGDDAMHVARAACHRWCRTARDALRR